MGHPLGPAGRAQRWATRTLTGVYGILVLPVLLAAINEVVAAVRFGRDALTIEPPMRVAMVDFGRIMTFGIASMTALLAVDLPLGPRLPVAALISLALHRLVACAAAEPALARRSENCAKAATATRSRDTTRSTTRTRTTADSVPKLSGLGWTIDFSHPLGWPMLLLLLGVPIRGRTPGGDRPLTVAEHHGVPDATQRNPRWSAPLEGSPLPRDPTR